jgi:hypothetical protein
MLWRNDINCIKQKHIESGCEIQMAHTKQIPVCKYGDRYMLLRAYGYIYFKVDELKINHPCITHILI